MGSSLIEFWNGTCFFVGNLLLITVLTLIALVTFAEERSLSSFSRLICLSRAASIIAVDEIRIMGVVDNRLSFVTLLALITSTSGLGAWRAGVACSSLDKHVLTSTLVEATPGDGDGFKLLANSGDTLDGDVIGEDSSEFILAWLSVWLAGWYLLHWYYGTLCCAA